MQTPTQTIATHKHLHLYEYISICNYTLVYIRVDKWCGIWAYGIEETYATLTENAPIPDVCAVKGPQLASAAPRADKKTRDTTYRTLNRTVRATLPGNAAKPGHGSGAVVRDSGPTCVPTTVLLSCGTGRAKWLQKRFVCHGLLPGAGAYCRREYMQRTQLHSHIGQIRQPANASGLSLTARCCVTSFGLTHRTNKPPTDSCQVGSRL
ncbi:hypothetical protein TPHA_0A05920 [Tetrapisispora phaffii CBS 4417]|uniref:Uncharacterized protein n=1 Tax=Tetrapisispora phaffii (strain ATCC 24235 / CBS 4417 / NBRC 1672 / NRRL Y-8282 / UCD 70-5) TaxID=1071381 RepID=G8BP38_TETPH|nr:hypothetical protein TPHA_0A05920 [Tetrapisispora phaffii CBS 4417]CCE61666.1 hypothetical protein TPHA_0A05920 [Tetrapisispora phaffii CBS 4417]